jgi:zinc transporter ZupT
MKRARNLLGPLGVALAIGIFSILNEQHGVVRLVLALIAGMALGLGVRQIVREAREQQ